MKRQKEAQSRQEEKDDEERFGPFFGKLVESRTARARASSEGSAAEDVCNPYLAPFPSMHHLEAPAPSSAATASAQPIMLSRDSLQGIPYNSTLAAEPPIPILTPVKPPPNKKLAKLRKSRNPQHEEEVRRDSGLAPSVRESGTTFTTDVDRVSSVRRSSSLPSFRASPRMASPNTHTLSAVDINGQTDASKQPSAPFMKLSTEIPTGSFEDLTSPGQLEFSKRGSILLGGKKANVKRESIKNGNLVGSRRQYPSSSLAPVPSIPSRILSTDEEALSRKLMSLYENGGDEADITAKGENGTNGGSPQRRHPTIRVISASKEGPKCSSESAGPSAISELIKNPSLNGLMQLDSELAGGIEDWEDVNNGDVDRYGFIVPRPISSPASSLRSSQYRPVSERTSRISAIFHGGLSPNPRRQPSRLSKARSTKSPTHSTDHFSLAPSASGQLRPNSSQGTYRSTNGSTSAFRSATNKLPYNRDRRYVDQAADMLNLTPALADIAEDDANDQQSTSLKRRERERDEKWRKMARAVNDVHGGGMSFTFDTRNPKLIERTWKGIPDKWRATAWHAFLSASARRRKDCLSDSQLKTIYQELLLQGSPDDVQIDLDVPRTINSHIMFRRRYRGGQRLLFRVLHCMSIYFPEIGYVQGMAAIAATLLCYYDEESAFVMLVRLWQLRGFEQLYRSGFSGLMTALEEFEQQWMGKGKVATKLTQLGITPTAYGTRWYLTLFNYSIPFPAQLRVWDVFMLLGDPDIPYNATPPPPSTEKNDATTTSPTSFHHGLDILHACSAALIDGMREILLDSDFENAMKVLTSWIPIRDEEVLMRVAKVEWKTKSRRL